MWVATVVVARAPQLSTGMAVARPAPWSFFLRSATASTYLSRTASAIWGVLVRAPLAQCLALFVRVQRDAADMRFHPRSWWARGMRAPTTWAAPRLMKIAAGPTRDPALRSAAGSVDPSPMLCVLARS
eukprot:6254401-Pyramimonas_sp.AAC.1